LDQPAVAAVIIGTRLSISSHLEANKRLFSFALDEEDHKNINAVLSRSQMLPGDCGDEYRS
jgi:aryl-alcohol dehydrogenase-like predicted oxidoreductase